MRMRTPAEALSEVPRAKEASSPPCVAASPAGVAASAAKAGSTIPPCPSGCSSRAIPTCDSRSPRFGVTSTSMRTSSRPVAAANGDPVSYSPSSNMIPA